MERNFLSLCHVLCVWPQTHDADPALCMACRHTQTARHAKHSLPFPRRCCIRWTCAASTFPKGIRASYIKPVQTVSPSDATFVSRHADKAGNKIGSGNVDDAPSLCRISTLFDYSDPVSPYLVAERNCGYIASDTDIVEATVKEIKATLLRGCGSTNTSTSTSTSPSGNLVLVEAAGGVLSPAPSGSPQADTFRPMRLPVILVGDGKLGGIGATLSALESLRTRGYSVLGIALLAQGLLCFYFGRGRGGERRRRLKHRASLCIDQLPPLS